MSHRVPALLSGETSIKSSDPTTACGAGADQAVSDSRSSLGNPLTPGPEAGLLGPQMEPKLRKYQGRIKEDPWDGRRTGIHLSGLVLSQGLVSTGRDDAFYHRAVWPFEEKENYESAWIFTWPGQNSGVV